VLNSPSRRTLAYLQACEKTARKQDKTAFFGFCRSGLQMTGQYAQTEATHIHLWRDPRSQFASYDWPNNRYFLPQTIAQIAYSKTLRRHLDAFEPALTFKERVRRASAQYRFEPLKAYSNQLLEAVTAGDHYALFYLVWLVSYRAAQEIAELSFSIEQLNDNPKLAASFEEQFSVSLQGIDWKRKSIDASVDYAAIEKEVENSLSLNR
ncbi:MAG: hypothetical protein AAFR27_12780, partial [Pseudomonadota bacterium]